MKEHEKECGQTFACDACKKSFTSMKTLRSHQRKSHENKGKLCSYCEKVFVSDSKLRRHIITHEKSIFKCDQCDSTFTRKDNFERHTKKH